MFHASNNCPDRAFSRTITQHTANLSEDGAHIIVPQGATCSKLAFQEHRRFESQANDHWATWFSFAREQLQGPLRSLYLITGLCRTRSWALSSFNKKDGREVPVTCELVEQNGELRVDASRWNPLGRFASGIGPLTNSREHGNQTIFVQSFTITSNGVVRHPNQEQLATCEEPDLTESSESTDRESTTEATDQSEPVQPDSGSSGGATAAGTTLTHTDSTTIQHVPQATLVGLDPHPELHDLKTLLISLYIRRK